MILYLLIAILVSFLCSIIEAVLLSIDPVFITIKIQEKKSYAFTLKKFKENIDKPLAAILTLNTFAHTVGAAGVGVQVQLLWGDEFLTLASVVLTILILIFSEIIPKTIGANYWQQLVPFMIFVLRILLVILYPFVIISQMITKFFNKKERKGILSRLEFSAMAEAGMKAGIFDKDETKIIQNIVIFDKVKTRDVMTPRTVVFACDEEAMIKDFYKANRDFRFSRIPVYKGSIDKISGYVLKQDILNSIIAKKDDTPLKSLLREIPVVFEGLAIPELYRMLIGQNEHIAFVVDEYGGTAGIVTMEDVIETVIGMEIMDETDKIEDLQKAARIKWEERARKMGIDPEKLK